MKGPSGIRKMRCPGNNWAANLAVGQAIVFRGLPSSRAVRSIQFIADSTPANPCG